MHITLALMVYFDLIVDTQSMDNKLDDNCYQVFITSRAVQYLSPVLTLTL